MTRLEKLYRDVTDYVYGMIIEFNDGHDEYFLMNTNSVDSTFRIDYKKTFRYIEEMKMHYVSLYRNNIIDRYDIDYAEPCIWWIKRDGSEEFIFENDLPKKHIEGIVKAVDSDKGYYIEGEER